MPIKNNCCGKQIVTPYCPYCGESPRGEQVLRGDDIDEIIRERVEGPRGPVDMPQFFRGQGLTVGPSGQGASTRKVTIVSENINGDLICSMTMTRPECVRLLLGCKIPIQNRNEG